jgi:hypothetical protein
MLPIAQSSRRGMRTTIWGQVRPGAGPKLYLLQRLALGRWVPVGRPRFTNARGTYTRVVRAGRGTRFRTAWVAGKRLSRPIAVR